MTLHTIRDHDINGKTVLVRTDYNVPLQNGEITSDFRIRASLPTLQYLLEHGANKIILISHLGKPKGQNVPELSLAPVAQRLSELLKKPVAFATIQDAQQKIQDLSAGGIILLENLRFDPREEENSADFAKELVALTGADLFVQDGFAVLHRAHASTVALAQLLPTTAGLLVKHEVDNLSNILHNPEKPFVIIIGGAKVDDKAPLITQLSPLADRVFVGGKISADGYTTDDPKVDVATSFETDATGARLDVTRSWVEQLLHYLDEHQVKTVFWNGVLGKVEDPKFAESSKLLAEYLGSHPEIASIICGGDTSGFVENLLATQPNLQFTLISTGGGASLEFLNHAKLPGLEILY